jgi:hypothetical protein
MHVAISIPGTAKSFSSGNFLNLMEPFDLAPLILRKSSVFNTITSLHSPQRPSEEKLPYRPLTLDSHQEENVVHFIQDRFDSGNYVPQREVLNYVDQNFGKILTYGWSRIFLDRHRSQVTRAIVHPQEHVRLQVPRCRLDSYIQLIKKYVPKIQQS